MDDKTYKRMLMSCSCGHVSRSMNEEARHRHNFPLLCRKKRTGREASKKRRQKGKNGAPN